MKQENTVKQKSKTKYESLVAYGIKIIRYTNHRLEQLQTERLISGTAQSYRMCLKN